MYLSKYIISLIFVFPSFTEVKTQNLIMNPDFEDKNLCHEFNSPCSPAGWLSCTSTMPEYRDSYLEMTVYNSGGKNRRDYIQTQFLCDMQEGEEYIISLKIKQDQCVISSLGLLITNQFYYRNRNELLDTEPTLDLTPQFTEYSKKLQQNWIELTVNYIAQGGEKFILIGNFQNDKEQQRKFVEKERVFVDYKIALDNVNVIKVNEDSLCEHADSVKASWHNYTYRHGPLTFTPYIPKKDNSATVPITTEIIKKTDSITLQDIIFEFNSYELTEDAKNQITEIFKNKDFDSFHEIHIEGHTDNVGKAEYNLDLSKKRAESVKALLTEIGIDENIMFTDGKGDRFPIEDNSTYEGRKANRRIEIRVRYR
jgi:outer membrane protein OmpA-like peptidoglycan-associated protein